MDPATAAITALGVIVAAFFAWLGKREFSRRAAKVDETRQKIDVMKEIREARKDDVEHIHRERNERIKLEERVREIERRQRDEQAKRERIARDLDEERKEREKLASLYRRLADLYSQLERRFQEAVTYIRALLDRLRENDIDHPEPPDWLAAHLPPREDES